MVLKAVFLEFNGVILKDIDLQRRLMDKILISENLRPDPTEFGQVCIGRSDRTCLDQLLTRRGRATSKASLDKLLAQKSRAYIQQLSADNTLPLYPGLQDFLYQLKAASLPLGVVTAAQKAEVDWVLAQANLMDQFAVTITGNDLTVDEDKPATKLYEQAIARLNEQLPQSASQSASQSAILPEECLAVEASFAGITAAKQARVPVVGVAHFYPYRMMQRQATWAVDYLNEIDLAWIQQRYEPKPLTVSEASG